MFNNQLSNQQIQDQESDLSRCASEKVRREQVREQVLDRLWKIAKMAPETTRNSVSGRVKTLSITPKEQKEPKKIEFYRIL